MVDSTESPEDSNETNNPIELAKLGDDSDFVLSTTWQACYHQQVLLQQQPLLFVLLAAYADQQHWTDQQFVSCSTLPAKTLLTSINLPVTEANLAVIAQVTKVDHKEVPCRYEREQLAALYQFFQINAASSLSNKIIPDSINQLVQLAELFAEYPALLNARFIKNGPRKSLCMTISVRKLAEIHRLAAALDIDITKRIKRCRHDRDLHILQRCLEGLASDVIVERCEAINIDDLDIVIKQLGRLLGNYEREALDIHWFDHYGPSPLVGNKRIIPLRSYQDLFMESHLQHNCTVWHHLDVEIEDMVFMRVLAPERATLALKLNPDTGRFRIDQLLLKENKPVSASTRRYIRHWLKRVQPKS